MRVLFITSAYPSNARDPRGFFIHQLARALARQGATVTVLAPASPSALREETLDGVTVRRAIYWIPRWQSLATGFGGIVPNLRKRPWLALQVPPLLAALTRDAMKLGRAADIIHAHWIYPAGIAGVVAARRHRVPLVVTSHGTDLALAARLAPLRWLSRWVCGAAHACVAVSHGLALALQGIRVPATPVQVIPMGVDHSVEESSGTILDSPDYLKFRDHQGLRTVFVGRLVPSKSVETLLAAHRELERRGRSIACALIGAGPSEQALRRRVEQDRSRRVYFAGAVPPDQVPHWLAAGQVLVLPSIAEGRGIVILEAMAQGLPAVVSDIPGPRELVRHGETGFLFPPGDAAALADCLERLIEDEAMRGELGRRARRFVEAEALTSEACAREYLALYQGIRADASLPSGHESANELSR